MATAKWEDSGLVYVNAREKKWRPVGEKDSILLSRVGHEQKAYMRNFRCVTVKCGWYWVIEWGKHNAWEDGEKAVGPYTSARKAEAAARKYYAERTSNAE